MKTFVTFLGRGRENAKTGYREATYKFPDESTKTTAFFGLALAEYIKPDRIVILGTKSSQWGVLVENLAAEGEAEEARLEILDAETKGEIEQKHLDKVTELICRAVGPKVVPRLIPFGVDENEQYKILDVIATNVPEGVVNFDLTHGFRHFGMIGFLSAFMIARVRGLEVKNRRLEVKDLWYGALEMTKDGITPVLRLDGLDRVRQWLDALNRFDATGDYRVFGSLLVKDGVAEDKAKHLENAAFHERTLNLSAAAGEIHKFKPVLASNLTGASGLFQQRLADRLMWVDLDTLSKQQAELAQQYLERRDYVRAVLFAWESLITKACEEKGLNPKVQGNRERQNVLIAVGADNQQFCRNLNQIRRALAHANPPNAERVQEILIDEQTLREALQEAFNRLLPKRDSRTVL